MSSLFERAKVQILIDSKTKQLYFGINLSNNSSHWREMVSLRSRRDKMSKHLQFMARI